MDMPGMLMPPIDWACASKGAIAARPAPATIKPKRGLMPHLPGGGH